MRFLRGLSIAAWGLIAFSCIGVSVAQSSLNTTPCGVAPESAPWPGTSGLQPVEGGAIVYDSNLGLCWLSDANLAGNPLVRATVKLSGANTDGSPPVINPDGTMDYQTALNWVAALNSYNHGKGWLNHNNWQLPATPESDPTCSSLNVANFGVLCKGSAMGNLYNVGLADVYPNSVVPVFFTIVWPFFNLQPGLYWTSSTNSGGQATFSFNNGQSGGNTTKYNFFHVLPMTKSVLGPLPPGSGVLPYIGGPGAGKAVYDTNTGISWTLNANLPADTNFGVTGTTTLPPDNTISPPDINGITLTVPLVDRDGDVHFSAIDPKAATGWIVSMNVANYAGSSTWMLPCVGDLEMLYQDLGIEAGVPRLEWPLSSGPFLHLQPGFYWGCERDPLTSGNAPCDYSQNAPPSSASPPMEFSFNFDDGFLGTDQDTKQFYVMVYYPAP